MTPITLVKDYRTMSEPTSNATNVVPCGKCVLCLKRRQNAWTFRLTQESKISTSAVFLTLTYTDEKLPISFNGHATLRKKDFQDFMKRLRKHIRYHSLSKEQLKYYACGEYGTDTKRPHYHAIMFNLPHSIIRRQALLHETWKNGHVDLAPCNMATIRYVTKYLMKGRHEPERDDDDRAPPFALMSKKMGLSYLTPQMVKHHTEKMVSYVTLSGGTLTSLPRYFRDKIFSKVEKKLLNEEAAQIREYNFEKLFNNSYRHEYIWKKDVIRKQEKANRLERAKI